MSLRPYITPAQFHKDKKLDASVAIICYCPYPKFFDKYLEEVATIRYFIHTPTNEVKFCKINDERVVVISEVYGGPVSSTTVEELSYYGIKQIIGIGFAGGLNDSEKIGDIFFAVSCFADESVTKRYVESDFAIIPNPLNQSFRDILAKYNDLFKSDKVKYVGKKVWVTDSLYNETKPQIKLALKKGCKVVNMDTSHLYAICELKKIECIYFGVITDIVSDDGWEDSLSGIVSDKVESDSDNIVLKSQEKMLSVIVDNLI